MMQRALLFGIAYVAVIAMIFVDPIRQDPAYHGFADGRALFGVPNFWNVATNAPFLVIGIAALAAWRRSVLRLHYVVLCLGIALVSVGSGWYHLGPSSPALVFDRVPMTVAFMALFSAVVADRVSPVLGRKLLWPLVAAGITSIAWWHVTEQAGAGDLRFYALVQFLPMLLLPLILLLFRNGELESRWLWAAFAAYGVAKIAEYFDAGIYSAGGLLSGHSLKHLLAAFAAWASLRAFTGRGIDRTQPDGR